MAAKTNSTPFTKKKAIIFVTGMSGTGKSTVLKELSLKGHKIVDTDYDGLIVYGTDPRWGPGWLWDEKRMKSILTEHTQGTLFIAGTVSNQRKFYSHFDAIVLLSAPLEVMRERIEFRSTNNYGKTKEQWEEIVHYTKKIEPLIRNGANFEIDTRKPLNQIVDELEQIACD